MTIVIRFRSFYGKMYHVMSCNLVRHLLISALFNGMISNFLEWYEFGSAIDTISRDQKFAICINDPLSQSISWKSRKLFWVKSHIRYKSQLERERSIIIPMNDNYVKMMFWIMKTHDDRMNGSNPSGSQHGNHQFDCHRHVTCNPITLLDALRLVNICQFTDLCLQFIIADLTILEWFTCFTVNFSFEWGKERSLFQFTLHNSIICGQLEMRGESLSRYSLI